MKNLLNYFKKVVEEFAKIKFYSRSETIGVVISAMVIVFVCSIIFYLIDFISLFVVNRLIIGL